MGREKVSMSSFTKDPMEFSGSEALKRNSVISFSCAACGKCCSREGNSGIFLTGADVFRLAEHLGTSCSELIDRKLEVSYDPATGLYMCTMGYREYGGSCTFQRQGKCTVYSARPRTCAMYPIAKSTDFAFNDNKYVVLEPRFSVNRFDLECSPLREDHTVEQWFDRNGIPVLDEWEEQWYLACVKVANIVRKNRVGNKQVLRRIFSLLYREIEPGASDYIGVIEENCAEAVSILNGFLTAN